MNEDERKERLTRLAALSIPELEQQAQATIAVCACGAGLTPALAQYAAAYRDIQLGIALRKINTLASADGMKMLANLYQEMLAFNEAEKTRKAQEAAAQ